MTRLWCVMELFVYLYMGSEYTTLELRILDGAHIDATHYDVGLAVCTQREDRERLLEIIEGPQGGGIRELNAYITRLFVGAAARRGTERPVSPSPFFAKLSSPSQSPAPNPHRRRTGTKSATTIRSMVWIGAPGPDDLKSLAILATRHNVLLTLRAVICNGGRQAEDRASLARCFFDNLGNTHASKIPVGVGSAGEPYTAADHEYDIDGWDLVDRRQFENGHTMLRRIVRYAAPHSLTFLCTSSLRDLCDLIAADEDGFTQACERVVIQGGVTLLANGEYQPDSSQNNLLDLSAAEKVYSVLVQRNIPATIIGRDAVPLIPMQLARSFADIAGPGPGSVIMQYLSNAQISSLAHLWRRLCLAKLPSRCTKEWFFSNFCGLTHDDIQQRNLDSLDADDDIRSLLNGFIKPYSGMDWAPGDPIKVAHRPHTPPAFPRGSGLHHGRNGRHEAPVPRQAKGPQGRGPPPAPNRAGRHGRNGRSCAPTGDLQQSHPRGAEAQLPQEHAREDAAHAPHQLDHAPRKSVLSRLHVAIG